MIQKNKTTPFLKVVCSSALLLLSGCKATEQDILKEEIVYSQEVSDSYEKLGKCLLDRLKMEKEDTYVSQQYVQGMVLTDRVTTVIYGKDDIASKTYHIFHVLYAGLHTKRFWSVSVKDLGQTPSKVLVQLRLEKRFPSLASLFTSPDLDKKILKEYISECSENPNWIGF